MHRRSLPCIAYLCHARLLCIATPPAWCRVSQSKYSKTLARSTERHLRPAVHPAAARASCGCASWPHAGPLAAAAAPPAPGSAARLVSAHATCGCR